MKETALVFARRVRNFDPKAFVFRHTTGLYLTCCGILTLYANVAQYQRMKLMYPDYEKVRRTSGEQMRRAKEQELSDVMRYNNMVEGMRGDLTSGGGGRG